MIVTRSCAGMSQSWRRITPSSGPCGPGMTCARDDSQPSKNVRTSPKTTFANSRVIGATGRAIAEAVLIFAGKTLDFCAVKPSVIHIVNRSLNEALDANRLACSYSHMSTVLIEIRRAKPSDAKAVADTHDEAWRAAYQGIIPGVELDKLITRRGPDWWDSAIRKGSRIAILAFGDKVAGYANYGRNRARS